MTRTYEASPRWGFRGPHPGDAVVGAGPGVHHGLQVCPERLALSLLAEEQRQVLSLLGRLRRSAQTAQAQASQHQTQIRTQAQPPQRRAG
ncbi:hypothetical protein [Deinococcus aerophilus]|nr:hypothetical protein [Deinococcus aerophilus]